MKKLFTLTAIASTTLWGSALEFLVVDNISVADGWQTVEFDEPLNDPIVVTGGITNNDPDSALAQIRNITSTSFQIRLSNWGTQQLHTASESITCMIAEAGTQEYGGLTIVAGKQQVIPNTYDTDGRSNFHSITLPQAILKQDNSVGDWNYHVFGQVIGDGSLPINVRNSIEPTSTNNYQYRFELGRRTSSSDTVKEMQYIAIQNGATDGTTQMDIQTFTTNNLFDHDLKLLVFDTELINPLLMLNMPNIKGSDSTVIRYQDLNASSARLRTDEGPEWNETHADEHASVVLISSNLDAPQNSSFNSLTANEGSFSDTLSVGTGHTTSGERAITFGQDNTASGLASAAFGADNTASGGGSTTFGTQNTASGGASTAFGVNTEARQYLTTTFGEGTLATIVHQFAIGRYNEPPFVLHTIIPHELFVVGNGSSDTDRSNAFSVQNDGDVVVYDRLLIGDYGNILSDSNINPDTIFAIGSTPDDDTSLTARPSTTFSITDSGDVTIAGNFTTNGFGANPSRATGGSFAGGVESLADGTNSIAFGEGAMARSYCSVAFGHHSTAKAFSAVAAGNVCSARGDASVAMGEQTQALAAYSGAFGLGSISSKRGQFTVGEYNIETETDHAGSETDDLFVVGNGTNVHNRANAFTVRRNGDVIITKPQGDISMGIYGEE